MLRDNNGITLHVRLHLEQIYSKLNAIYYAICLL